MFEIKIEGLDEVQRQIEEVGIAAKLIDKIAIPDFDPSDPKSKKEAIRKCEEIVDGKLRQYKNNPLVGDLIKKVKQNIKDTVNNHKP